MKNAGEWANEAERAVATKIHGGQKSKGGNGQGREIQVKLLGFGGKR